MQVAVMRRNFILRQTGWHLQVSVLQSNTEAPGQIGRPGRQD
jgi:hypothetical protein